jgi:type IV pilus assembly protein PilX
MKREKGGALIITLIAMAVLLIGAVSLLRSSNTASAIAANAAMKQAAAEAADTGLQSGAVVLAGISNLEAHIAGSYFATQQATDANGLLTADWTTVATHQAGNYQVQYLIDRLCDAPLPVANTSAQCSISPSVSDSTSHRVGAPVYTPKAPVYYRITARVVGPKSTESYVQAVLSK